MLYVNDLTSLNALVTHNFPLCPIRWFYSLCDHFGVHGQAYYFFKLHGKGRTAGVKPHKALADLKVGLRDPSQVFIYHCYNHYFCPIGYEEVPKKAKDAYK